MFTSREYSYLKQNGRAFRMDRDDAAAAFDRHGIPMIDLFLDFQVRFGGFCPDPDATFGIVKPSGQYTEGPTRHLVCDGLTKVRCDVNSLTQVRLWMDENGLFYFEADPVAESFESYIRYCAYIDVELAPLGWTFIDHERRCTRKFQKLLAGRDAPLVAKASDAFHQVKRADELYWITRPGYEELYVRPDVLKS